MSRIAARPLVAALMLGALMLPNAVAAAPATGDSVSGSGWRLTAGGEKRVQFRVDAHLAGSGAGGSYSYRNPFAGLGFSGPVKCLEVRGSQAAVGGLITKVNDPAFDNLLAQGFLVFLIDLGDPYRGQVGPDILSQTYILPADAGNVVVPGDFPTTCPDPQTTDHDIFDMVGNVTVKDG